MKLNLNIRRILIAVIGLLVIFEVSFLTFININDITTDECWNSLEENAKNIDAQFVSIYISDESNLKILCKLIEETSWIRGKKAVNYFRNFRVGVYNFPIRYYNIEGDYLICEDGIIDDYLKNNSENQNESDDILSIYDHDRINSTVISGVHYDSFSKTNVVELMLPVYQSGKKIGILSEIIKLDRLNENIAIRSSDNKYCIFIMDRKSQRFIMDTYHNSTDKGIDDCLIGDVVEPYSFDTFKKNVTSGIGDKIAFKSSDNKVNYIYAVNSDVSDYMVMVLANEDVVFEKSNKVRSSFILLFIVEVLIILCSTIWLLWATKTRINQNKKEIEKMINEANSDKITYELVMKALSNTYEIVYYVDCNDNHYEMLKSKEDDNELRIMDNGDDFFAFVANDISQTIFTPDQKMVEDFFEKKKLIRKLREQKGLSLMYRRVEDGKPIYYNARFALLDEFGARHIIIGISNVHDQHLQTLEYQARLEEMKAMNNKDPLTGVNDRKAFEMAEERISQKTDLDIHPYSIVVCNINNMMEINESLGENVGDEFICDASKLICENFTHSPVYRIGGDEFAVILTGKDFAIRKDIVAKFKEIILNNLELGDIVIATGMADYDKTKSFKDILNEANSDMNKNKESLKQINF